jgi:AhpD family alkylhydroperoxidase
MQKRFNWAEVDPEVYPLFRGLDRHIRERGLSAEHFDLIKLYGSQLNGCSYCVAAHADESLKDGISAQRLLQIGVYRESPLFDEKDRIVLQLTREVTYIGERVSDSTYARAMELLGEAYTAQVILAAIAINIWNRVGIATNMVPPPA